MLTPDRRRIDRRIERGRVRRKRHRHRSRGLCGSWDSGQTRRCHEDHGSSPNNKRLAGRATGRLLLAVDSKQKYRRCFLPAQGLWSRRDLLAHSGQADSGETRGERRPMNTIEVALDDKYRQLHGPVFMTGMQALVRLALEQRRADAAAGFNTAGFISGYRGSPMGGFDRELWRAQKFLDEHHIRFQPGVNEEIAATSLVGHAAGRPVSRPALRRRVRHVVRQGARASIGPAMRYGTPIRRDRRRSAAFLRSSATIMRRNPRPSAHKANLLSSTG